MDQESKSPIRRPGLWITGAVLFAAFVICLFSIERNGDGFLTQEAAPDVGFGVQGIGASEEKVTKFDGKLSSQEASNTTESLHERWDSITASDKSPAHKKFGYEACIVALCSEGRLGEALGLVETTFGEGAMRRSLLHFLAANGESLQELCEVVSDTQDPNDRSAMVAGLSIVLARSMELDSMDIEALKIIGADSDLVIKEAFDLALDSWSRSKMDAAERVKSGLKMLDRFREAEMLSAESESELILRLGAGAPFEVWKLAGLDSDDKEFNAILGLMAKADPERAMGLINRDDDHGQSSIVFSEWLALDASAAKRWFEANGDEGSSKVNGSLTSILARDYASKGEIDAARHLLDQISDPVQRDRVEGQIWSVERENLRREVSRSPEGTVSKIVDGQSSYDSYWLEEAVHTWVSKDFDSANHWYQRNWASLPKEKAQYVAAGFATHAINQGDLDTARQWAGMIQDTKTRERIERSIAKEAGE